MISTPSSASPVYSWRAYGLTPPTLALRQEPPENRVPFFTSGWPSVTGEMSSQVMKSLRALMLINTYLGDPALAG